MSRGAPYRVVPLPYRETDSHRVVKLFTAVYRALLSDRGPFLFSLGLIMGRVTVLGTMRPFALAYLSLMAVMKSPSGTAGAFGAFLGMGLFANPVLALEALGVYCLSALVSRKTRFDRGWIFLLCWFGGDVAYHVGAGLDILTSATQSILAAALSVMLVPALELLPTSRRDEISSKLYFSWSHVEFLAVGVFAAAILRGIDVGYGQISSFDLAARYVILVIAVVGGAGYGALTGVLFGILGSISGHGAGSVIPVYVVGGAVAGLLHDHGKIGSILGFAVGIASLAWQTPVEGLGVQAMLTVPAAIALLMSPPSVQSFLGRVLPDSPIVKKSEKQAERLEAVVAGRMRDFAHIMEKLSDSFRPAPQELKENKIEAILNVVCGDVCSSCQLFRNCWQEGFHDTYWDFINLISEGNEGGAQVALPPSLSSRCPHSHRLGIQLNHALEIASLRGSWESRLSECRELVSNQLRGIAGVMSSFAEKAAVNATYETDVEARLWKLFGRFGIDVSAVTCLDLLTTREVTVTFTRTWDMNSVEDTVSPLLSSFFGTSYSVWMSDDSKTYTFLPERNYALEISAFKRAKQPGSVSGDGFTRVDLPNGKVAIVLSDGMGHGRQAALESGATLSMLEELLRAGFDKEFAIKTVNTVLLLRTPEDTFATVDMAVIDLFSGETEFVKIGSSPSFIKRGRSVEVIRSNSLPIGILNSIETDTKWRLLRHGDLLLMVTDGLIGTKGDDTGDWVCKVARQIESNDPAEVAEFLLDKASEGSKDGRLVDDATVVGIRLLARASAEVAGSEDGWVPAYARDANTS